MAFKKSQPAQVVPDSPEKILLDLSRRKIPSVLLHQGEIIKSYIKDALNSSDVALQLPTGSGKTLVGLLIAEWRRRKFKERVVYLCPTNQLVNQVAEQANDHYGLTVNGFTGKMTGYGKSEKAQYQAAESIAITNYSALFNTNPYFDNADVIIVDDAHSAENYISSLWSVRIDRNDKKHESIHQAVSSLLSPHLGHTNTNRLLGDVESTADQTWVDKLPTPFLKEIHDELIEIIDVYCGDLDIKYSWSMIKSHLMACHVYLSPNDILIKPLIPPTWTHKPFSGATQRIFMSATLGMGGDLERLTGRKKILRLKTPEGWSKQSIGRRFFMFPGSSLEEEDSDLLQMQLMTHAGRSLVLVPSENMLKEISKGVLKELKFKVFNADDIENSKNPFISEKNAVAVVANRYDGIDFPGNDCRLLFINGLPKATNSQERFLMSRMAANALFNERIQTRVLQAIGRCTRSLEDFSAVVVTGEELSNYLADVKRRSYLHPELQAELEFGLEQSKDSSLENFVDNFKIFIKNGREWEQNGNEEILSRREAIRQKAFPGISELQSTVVYEIKFQEALWQEDYSTALASAESVLAHLTASELIGYRALWSYLAGSSAWQGELKSKARVHFDAAKKSAPGITWLVKLASYQTAPSTLKEIDNAILSSQIDRIEVLLDSLGLSHSRKYDIREKEILDGLLDPEKFERSQILLGEMLGYVSGKEESDASPDPWWIAGNICIVFEDNAGAENDFIDATKARQAASHPNWIKENLKTLEPNSIITSVLVTPKKKAKVGAIPHLKQVCLWNLEDYVEWARQALSIIRQLRTTFEEIGSLEWRKNAEETFLKNRLDAPSLLKSLQSSIASEILESLR